MEREDPSPQIVIHFKILGENENIQSIIWGQCLLNWAHSFYILYTCICIILYS